MIIEAGGSERKQAKQTQVQAIILHGVGGLYTVFSPEDGQEHVLRARGVFRRARRTPLVGDRVLCTPGKGEEHGWIDDILPRQSECLRPPVANVELMALVVAPSPQPDLLLVDRLLVWARRAGIEPLLCANKADLDGGFGEEMRAQYQPAGAKVQITSAVTGKGVDLLRARLAGRVSCFAGQSAAGKSSLLNALYGLELATGALSLRSKRGRHTTRHTRLLRCGDAMVVDTPGFSLLELWDALPPEELCRYYPEFDAYAGRCRFHPCLHDREPGCAVREALNNPKDSEDSGSSAPHPHRFERYRALLGEVRAQWKERYH